MWVPVKYTLGNDQMTELTGLGPLCFQFYYVIDFAWGVMFRIYICLIPNPKSNIYIFAKMLLAYFYLV